MPHRAAVTAVLALGATLGLGAGAHAFIIKIKPIYITSYQTGGSSSSIEVPGYVAVELSERPDGSLQGVLTQGTKRLPVKATLEGCSAPSAAAQHGEIEIESWSWGETNEGSHLISGGREQLRFRSPKDPRCTLVVTLVTVSTRTGHIGSPAPPQPQRPDDLKNRPKPPVPVLLPQSSNDPGPGGDEPKDPGRTTEEAPPPPERR